MDPNIMYQFMLIAAVVLLVRLALAIIATKRNGWGWYPWIVIGCEIGLAILLPNMEPLIGLTSLIILIFMAIKKKKPKEVTA